MNYAFTTTEVYFLTEGIEIAILNLLNTQTHTHTHSLTHTNTHTSPKYLGLPSLYHVLFSDVHCNLCVLKTSFKRF